MVLRNGLVLSILITSSGVFGQSLTNIPLPSYEILSNEVRVLGKSDISQRDVFVLLREIPTKESIAKLFNSIQSKHCSPYDLRVVAYNDREMIEKQIRFEKFPVFVDFNDSKGLEAARTYYASAMPKAAGYFRSRYYRYSDFEFFDYSPKIDAAEMERVDLAKDPSKQGNLADSPCEGGKPNRQALVSSESDQTFYTELRRARGLLIRYNTTFSVWNTSDQNIVWSYWLALVPSPSLSSHIQVICNQVVGSSPITGSGGRFDHRHGRETPVRLKRPSP